MIFHSTNGISRSQSFPEVIANGMAPDGGLYMPDTFPALPRAFFKNISEMSLKEIGYVVCTTLFSPMLSPRDIKRIVDETLTFPIPARKLQLKVREGENHENLVMVEMFHGPTLSCKDIGARFMARLLPILLKNRKFTILLASSGDSGGAIANAFQSIEGAEVVILYPRGELSRQQIAMFAGQPHVKSIEVGGTFDDCQALVKQALLDRELNEQIPLTAGNSINLARQLPAIICGFHAYARALELFPDAESVKMALPCGNLGNLSAALMAKKMGLPIEKFIGANNANDRFVEYLQTGGLQPRRALVTLARAMDVGNPSNLARIIDLYGGDLEKIRKDVEGVAFTDQEIVRTIQEIYDATGYLLGPQSATAYLALHGNLKAGEVGIAMATGHPAKFPAATRQAIGKSEPLPAGVPLAPSGIKPSIKIPPTFNALVRELKR